MPKKNPFAQLNETLKRTFQPIRDALQNVDRKETEEITKRMHAARNNPDDPKSEVWNIAIGDLTPREASKVWRYLPDPLARKGRPPGSGHVVQDVELLDALAERVGNNEKPTTAARKLLQKKGVRAGIKARADHLVRLLNNRAKNST